MVVVTAVGAGVTGAAVVASTAAVWVAATSMAVAWVAGSGALRSAVDFVVPRLTQAASMAAAILLDVVEDDLPEAGIAMDTVEVSGFAGGLAVGGALGYGYGYGYGGDYGDDYAYNNYYDNSDDSGPAYVVSTGQGDDSAYCAQRYKSFDPVPGHISGTMV